MPNLKIHTDGGSRGNPGPAAAAAVFLDSNNQVIFETSSFLGTATNNQAEYQGVIIALKHLLNNTQNYTQYDQVDFILDSELVVKQLNGIYKIKNPSIAPLANQVFDLISQLQTKITFSHVKRHLNKLPDALLNQTLDTHTS